VDPRLLAIRDYCRKHKINYLKADITIPETVKEEVKKINDMGFFIPHRTSHGRGWESATLHGEEWNITGYDADKKDQYKWTDLVEYAPTMTKWLKEEFPNNGSYGRCRFMLLRPGGFIRSHTDTHQWVEGMPLKDEITSAINIAITQPKNCYLRNSETKEEVPFEEGSVFWFNNGPFHEAANFSKENRYHFIVHGGWNEERAELFINSFCKEHPDAIID
jgi:hypothetical protein